MNSKLCTVLEIMRKSYVFRCIKLLIVDTLSIGRMMACVLLTHFWLCCAHAISSAESYHTNWWKDVLIRPKLFKVHLSKDFSTGKLVILTSVCHMELLTWHNVVCVSFRKSFTVPCLYQIIFLIYKENSKWYARICIQSVRYNILGSFCDHAWEDKFRCVRYITLFQQ